MNWAHLGVIRVVKVVVAGEVEERLLVVWARAAIGGVRGGLGTRRRLVRLCFGASGAGRLRLGVGDGGAAEDIALPLADLEDAAAVVEEDLGILGGRLAVELGLQGASLGEEVGGVVKVAVGVEGGALCAQVGEGDAARLEVVVGLGRLGRLCRRLGGGLAIGGGGGGGDGSLVPGGGRHPLLLCRCGRGHGRRERERRGINASEGAGCSREAEAGPSRRS